MLVLSRKIGERVIIGENIEVTVLKVCGNQVKLGFKAPLETAIRREELCLRFDDGPIDAARAESENDAVSQSLRKRCCAGVPGVAHAV